MLHNENKAGLHGAVTEGAVMYREGDITIQARNFPWVLVHFSVIYEEQFKWVKTGKLPFMKNE